jgi:cytochrome c oxidase cbb3-type subunit 3
MSSRFRTVELAAFVVAIGIAGALVACGRNAETSVPQAPNAQRQPQGTAVSGIYPGGGAQPPLDQAAMKYENDPKAIAEGKRLYDTYNCSGCHFAGAGGIGPALIDDKWIYGGRLDQIYASIYQGRPNGMPFWGDKLSSTEIWELAAYVHNLSAEGSKMTEPTKPPPATPDGAAREPQAPDVPTSPAVPTSEETH